MPTLVPTGMKKRDTDRMALQRAIEILGSVEALSERLLIPVEQLERWVAGRERLPLGVFSVLMDVLLEHSGQHKFTDKK